MKYYDIKDKDYFTGTRLDIISLLPNNPQQKVLEIGAGGGDTLVYIKKNGLAQEVVGFEFFKIPNSNQDNSLIDSFLFGNIEDDALPFANEYFDVIVLADVLEHLVDPWNVIKKVESKLKTGGKLLVSVPNIREISSIYKIVFKGDFKYNPEGGVLDQTHLRFFCKKNILNMLTIDTIRPTFACPSFEKGGGYGIKKRKLLNKFSFKVFEEFLAIQYLVVAEKIHV